MTSIQQKYIDENFDQFVEQLLEWLAIPSISTLPEYKKDVCRAADWVTKKLNSIGFEGAKTISTSSHPLVYAESLSDKNKPTLLIYGHYDVQPADPLEEWCTPPFQPTIRDENIYARGASDDKGQTLMILAALEAWLQTTGSLPVNVKVLLEGEEEAGGAAIEEFVQKNPELLQADAALICDTHMINSAQPSLITSLRGIVYTEIEVAGAKTDLHSGRFGGVAPNPIHALCVLISRLKGEDGIINIPELAAAIPAPSQDEKQLMMEDPHKLEAALRTEMGVEELIGEAEFSGLERLGIRPTLEVHGMRGGFSGEGAKTVIPATALAKVSLRLPAGLDPGEVFNWLEAAVNKNMPVGYTKQLKKIHSGKGVKVDPGNSYIRTAAEALTEEYGTAPALMRHGGSIPIASLFDEILKTPVVLMGFGLPDDAIHAPNEKFNLTQFKRGMITIVNYLKKLGHFEGNHT